MTTTKEKALANGHALALLILTGIKLEKTSKVFEKEATELLEGKPLEPRKIGHFTSQALHARNVIISEGLAEEGQQVANQIIKEFGIAPAS